MSVGHGKEDRRACGGVQIGRWWCGVVKFLAIFEVIMAMNNIT
jgi:hypothetical protein